MTLLRQRLASRYGVAQALDDVAVPASASRILEHLLDHRSVRSFRAEPLPAGTLELLVAAAQSAASSSNLQTWSVVAVTDQRRKDRLAELSNHQEHVSKAPLFLAWVADLSRLHRTAERKGDHADANRFLEMFVIAAIDAALAAQNAAVAAEALGLGTVYIGALRNHPEEVARELALPQRAFPLFGMCVGQPDPDRPAAVKPRLPQSTVLHLEQYSSQGEPDAVREYDQRMLAFQLGQQLPAVPWSEQAAKRVAGERSLSGRHRLADALRACGFPIE